VGYFFLEASIAQHVISVGRGADFSDPLRVEAEPAPSDDGYDTYPKKKRGRIYFT
jgi:hypothetical protein